MKTSCIVEIVGKGKEMKYAEGFRVITLVSDDDWQISKGDPLILENEKQLKSLDN